MKPTYDDTILMDELLLDAREELAQAEEIEAGRKARLTLTNYEGKVRRFLLPFRVAAYARKAMGVPAVVREYEMRAVFASRGITVSFYPTAEGYDAIIDAVLAYLSANSRAYRRKLRQRIALLKKGGAAL